MVSMTKYDAMNSVFKMSDEKEVVNLLSSINVQTDAGKTVVTEALKAMPDLLLPVILYKDSVNEHPTGENLFFSWLIDDENGKFLHCWRFTTWWKENEDYAEKVELWENKDYWEHEIFDLSDYSIGQLFWLLIKNQERFKLDVSKGLQSSTFYNAFSHELALALFSESVLTLTDQFLLRLKEYVAKEEILPSFVRIKYFDINTITLETTVIGFDPDEVQIIDGKEVVDTMEYSTFLQIITDCKTDFVEIEEFM